MRYAVATIINVSKKHRELFIDILKLNESTMFYNIDDHPNEKIREILDKEKIY